MTQYKQRPGEPWTILEIKLLERHYRALGARELQRRHLPHRTPSSLHRMARKLGVARTQRMTPWSKEEIELLLRHYGELSLRELQQRYFPHRTQASILDAAGRFGACRRALHKWSDEELRILQQVYPDGGIKAALRHLPSLTAKQIAIKASFHGIRLRSWRWTEEEIRQLIAHQHLPLGQLAALFPQRTKKAVDYKRREIRKSEGTAKREH